MRALVVYCHPRPESFTAAVRDLVLDRLATAGAEIQLLDLYANGFEPVLSAQDLVDYEDETENRRLVAEDVAALEWCDTLIFIYPTWWYGLPAMLKGWLDRVMLPGVAFVMPKGQNDTIKPGLQHITRLGVFTTCGASFWLTRYIGAPGKRTLLRGVGLLCSPRCKKVFAAHYLMDSSTDSSRLAHLERCRKRVDRFIGPALSKAFARKGAPA